MKCNDIITNIVIPIISSIISGGLTLIGVLITIKSENRKRKEEIRIANKPLFYILDPKQEYDYQSTVSFYFNSENETKESNNYIYGIIKNTDKAILIFDCIQIGDKKYYSLNGNVVDKNVIFNLYINTTEKTNNETIIFIIKDSLNNQYKYELTYSEENSKFISEYQEIVK